MAPQSLLRIHAVIVVSDTLSGNAGPGRSQRDTAGAPSRGADRGVTLEQKYSFAHISEQSIHAVVTASVEDVRRTCATWARDTGWALTATNSPGLLFAFSRSSSRWLGVDLEVVVFEHQDRRTGAEFTASMMTNTPGMFTDLSRIAETFARGVCSMLKAEGATIEPSYLGHASGDRNKIRRAVKWLGRVRLALLWSLIPIVALAATLAPERFFTAFVAAGWVVVLAMIPLYVRWRLVGAKVHILAVFFGLCVLALAGVTTVLLADSLGLL